MNVAYDPKTDILTVRLGPGAVADSDEPRPGVIEDYDESGSLVGLEILDASRKVEDFESALSALRARERDASGDPAEVVDEVRECLRLYDPGQPG